MLERYETPEMEVIELEVQDVVTTSGNGQTPPGGGGIVLPDDEW